MLLSTPLLLCGWWRGDHSVENSAGGIKPCYPGNLCVFFLVCGNFCMANQVKFFHE